MAPILVLSYLQEFDAANEKKERDEIHRKQKSCIIYGTWMRPLSPHWPLGALGVAVGPRQFIADQLLAKADAIRAMHERVQLRQDPQTECALLQESLGVSRINHILWMHGHTILQEKKAAGIYDEVGQRSLERLFPGFTEDSTEQAGHWVQEGAGHRQSCTSRDAHCSQTANLGYGSRCSDSRTSTETTRGDPLWRCY